LSLSNDLNRAKATTGIEGLDAIVDGGLSRGRVFLQGGEFRQGALSHGWQPDNIP
jgi:circadian clock protein KaiC